MPTFLKSSWLFTLSCTLLLGQQALGQSHNHSQGVQQASYVQPVQRRSTPAMRYFGRGVQPTTPVVQQRRRPAAAPVRPYRLAGGKPFQNVESGPSVTPYLNLDLLETSVGVPNYYTRVLPQLQQQQANQSQAAELRRLQQQLRLANATGVISNNRNGGVPTTGRSSQFMNVGNYFPAPR